MLVEQTLGIHFSMYYIHIHMYMHYDRYVICTCSSHCFTHYVCVYEDRGWSDVHVE